MAFQVDIQGIFHHLLNFILFYYFNFEKFPHVFGIYSLHSISLFICAMYFLLELRPIWLLISTISLPDPHSRICTNLFLFFHRFPETFLSIHSSQFLASSKPIWDLYSPTKPSCSLFLYFLQVCIRLLFSFLKCSIFNLPVKTWFVFFILPHCHWSLPGFHQFLPPLIPYLLSMPRILCNKSIKALIYYCYCPT